MIPPVQRRIDANNNGVIYGETPDGSWHGGRLPKDSKPGGGDFGGAGSSGDWGNGDGDGGGN